MLWGMLWEIPSAQGWDTMGVPGSVFSLACTCQMLHVCQKAGITSLRHGLLLSIPLQSRVHPLKYIRTLLPACPVRQLLGKGAVLLVMSLPRLELLTKWEGLC